MASENNIKQGFQYLLIFFGTILCLFSLNGNYEDLSLLSKGDTPQWHVFMPKKQASIYALVWFLIYSVLALCLAYGFYKRKTKFLTQISLIILIAIFIMDNLLYKFLTDFREP